jgi:hypothetical protein
MPAATGTRALRRHLTSTIGASTIGTSAIWTDTIGTSTIAPGAAGTSTIAGRTMAADTIGTSTIGVRAVTATRDGDPVPLPGTPWSVRPAAGPAGRPAAEIYAAGWLVDVMVAPALAPRVLRGACSLPWAGQPCAVAWGYLPSRHGFSVWFTRGLARSLYTARVSVIAGSFWIAPAGGRFRGVTVEHSGGRDRCRVRPARPR